MPAPASRSSFAYVLALVNGQVIVNVATRPILGHTLAPFLTSTKIPLQSILASVSRLVCVSAAAVETCESISLVPICPCTAVSLHS